MKTIIQLFKEVYKNSYIGKYIHHIKIQIYCRRHRYDTTFWTIHKELFDIK